MSEPCTSCGGASPYCLSCKVRAEFEAGVDSQDEAQVSDGEWTMR